MRVLLLVCQARRLGLHCLASPNHLNNPSSPKRQWPLQLLQLLHLKVGLELFSASGPSVVAALVEDGFQVFIDLKLSDIPTTTRKAARVLGALGATYLTVHVSAGPSSLRAGVEGFADGAERGGLPAPHERPRVGLYTCTSLDGDRLAGEHRLVEQNISFQETHIRGDHPA